ncbi:MAG: DUF2203 domain-containing protein [Solirubrobacterales bacterium]
MIHERHFTLEEANAELARVEPMLITLREAKSELLDDEAREALSDASPTNGGGDPGKQVGEAFLEVRRILVALTELGIVVRDVDRGLIDFPALRGDEEIYLCWKIGEGEIEYWHDTESGFGGRQPLEDG